MRRSSALYETLLEEFEDDATRAPDEDEALSTLPLDEVDDGEEEDLVEPAGEVEPDAAFRVWR